MRREEQVTVQGPVKKQQPDVMSHRGGRRHKKLVCLKLVSNSRPLSFFPEANLSVLGGRLGFARTINETPFPTCPWPLARAVALLRVDPTQRSETGTVQGPCWHSLPKERKGE